MCFSPEVDLAAGLFVGAVGIDAVRHVRRPAELPLACLPLVFAVHQLVETLVWLSLQGRLPDAVTAPAAGLYLAIAFGVLPILVPVAVSALEPATRRPQLYVFATIGVVVAAVLMYGVVQGPIEATIEGHHIRYHVDLWHGREITALYVVATCGSLLASTHRRVRVYAVGNLAAVGFLAWLNESGFVSLWCVWAAVTSVAIAVHLRATPPARTRVLTGVSGSP